MKDEFKGKTIILGVPYHFGLPERFKENLEYLGFEVVLIKHSYKSAKISLKDIIIHNYKKTFKKDRTHKGKIKTQLTEIYHLQQLSELQSKKDYALLIRPDMFSKKVIQKINNLSNYTVAYQWDGIERYPEVKNYIDFFDKFYVFDINDTIHNNSVIPLTNFYFDDLIQGNQSYEYDVYFVGSYFKERFESLLKLTDFFDANGLRVNFFLTGPKDIIAKPYNGKQLIQHVPLEMSFTENLHLLKKSKIILDFKNGVHYGISLRTFEAVGYKKKLITTNPLVKYFDFYHPANIYVIEDDNFTGLKEFLAVPYQDLPIEIVEKYSFTNWLKNVLQIEPHYKITIPYGTKD